jgi:Domain of unknown function (DUF4280)
VYVAGKSCSRSGDCRSVGVLTPMPCIPLTTSPSVPGAPTVMLGGNPTLDSTSTLMCMWAGVIQIVSPGEFIGNPVYLGMELAVELLDVMVDEQGEVFLAFPQRGR